MTIFYEKVAIGSSIIFSLTILLANKYDTLNVGLYILILCLIATATLFFGMIFKIKGNFSYTDLKFNKKDFNHYSISFFTFSKHLIPISIIVFISTFYDRWLIMNFYNPSEQGYYTLAQKIAGTVFVLSSTILPLILRELSVEVERGNNKEAFLLYNFYGDLLIILISSIYIFLIYNIEIIITYIGGSEFLNAKEIVLFLLILLFLGLEAIFQSYDRII